MVRLRIVFLAIIFAGCLDPTLPPSCGNGSLTTPELIPTCLENQGYISSADAVAATNLIDSAITLRDSLHSAGGTNPTSRALEVTEALRGVGDFYGRQQFADSARFHRLLDHVGVTLDHVRGQLTDHDGEIFPARTPWLSWHDYPGLGIQFQPVNTLLDVEWLLPSASTPTDTILGVSDALYRYALWRTAGGRRFPVWEYEFPWTSGGVSVTAPWVSGLAEGLGLALFAEAYRRTGDPQWHTRTYELLNALYVPWQDGGVLLPDTTHGYWWEEFHPTVQVWNGSAWALLGVGYAAQATADPEIARLFSRGIDALKYYTPFYDTGSWTLYSRTGGYNTIAYHHACILIMDAFYARTGDRWFKTVADRWRTYGPPPGVK